MQSRCEHCVGQTPRLCDETPFLTPLHAGSDEMHVITWTKFILHFFLTCEQRPNEGLSSCQHTKLCMNDIPLDFGVSHLLVHLFRQLCCAERSVRLRGYLGGWQVSPPGIATGLCGEGERGGG